ncbi:MAG: hypothetical protein U1E87_08160 [Alphaproteobacteria bacterium]
MREVKMKAHRRIAWLAGVAMLAGCASGPPLPPKVAIAFQKETLLVPAGAISLVDNYKPPLVSPNVEQNHETRPAHIPRRWIDARTKAIAGAPGAITLTVSDASVVEQPLEVKTDWKHALSRQAEKKLTANLAWRLSYDGPQLNWTADGTATSTQTVLEESSLNEADADYNAMIEALAAAFDGKLAQQLGELRAALASVGAPVPRR